MVHGASSCRPATTTTTRILLLLRAICCCCPAGGRLFPVSGHCCWGHQLCLLRTLVTAIHRVRVTVRQRHSKGLHALEAIPQLQCYLEEQGTRMNMLQDNDSLRRVLVYLLYRSNVSVCVNRLARHVDNLSARAQRHIPEYSRDIVLLSVVETGGGRRWRFWVIVDTAKPEEIQLQIERMKQKVVL